MDERANESLFNLDSLLATLVSQPFSLCEKVAFQSAPS